MAVPEDAVMLTDEETTVVWEFRDTDTDGGGVGGGVGGSGGDGGAGSGDGGSGDGGGGGGGGDGGSFETVGVTTVTQPDANGDARTVEDGDEFDPSGVLVSRYHLDHVQHPDGSSDFSRADAWTNGDTSEAFGSADASGNSSYSERRTHPNGSSELITRTTDPGGHGIEHTTWVDGAGNETGDTTSSF